jgi:hypothetical protein
MNHKHAAIYILVLIGIVAVVGLVLMMQAEKTGEIVRQNKRSPILDTKPVLVEPGKNPQYIPYPEPYQYPRYKRMPSYYPYSKPRGTPFPYPSPGDKYLPKPPTEIKTIK